LRILRKIYNGIVKALIPHRAYSFQ
jgi:hypothetical protein